MIGKECIKWMEEQNLLTAAKHYAPYFKTLLTKSLGMSDQPLLIIGDTGFENRQVASVIAVSCYFAAEHLKPCLILQDPIPAGDPASPEVIGALMALKPGSRIIASLSGRFGTFGPLGKSFRKYADEHHIRFTSTTSLGSVPTSNISILIDAINVDYDKLSKEHMEIKNLLDNAETVRVVTDAGTDVTFSIKGRLGVCADGIYTGDKLGGNIPPGEVYIPPVETETNGTVVIDGSSRNRAGTILIETPIKLTIKDGILTNIEGAVEADLLDQSLQWAESKAKYPERVRVVAELGIGLNPRAFITGTTIIDEKVRHTAHIAIGSNGWFGGKNKTVIHLDQVFKNPRIFVDGHELHIE